MTRPGARRRLAASAAAVLVLAACDSSLFLADPAPAPSSLEIHLLPSPPLDLSEATTVRPTHAAGPAATAEGPGRAFDRVDGIRVRLEAEEGTLVDEVFTVDPGDGEIRLVLEIELRESVVPAWLEVELRIGEQRVFRGGADVTLRRGARSEAELQLEAFAADLILPPAPEPLEALGDTVRLAAAVVFVTGDTIPDAIPSWRSLDPEVVEVSPDGAAVARADGVARLEASFEGLSGVLTVRVAQVVETVAIAPPEAELVPGETVRLEAEPLDRRGNPVPDRSAAWSSSDPEVASVDEEGLVRGLTPGSAEIVAAVGETEGTAPVTVAAVPPDVETLDPDELEADAARLRARVNPRGVPVEVVFEWSTDPAFAESVRGEPVQVAAGLEAVTVTDRATSLQPETTYHVRALAAGSSGTTVGNQVAFTTRPAPQVPERLSATFSRGDGEVTLLWFYPFEDADMVEFEVERAVVVDQTLTSWNRIATTTQPGYTDGAVTVGRTYAYRVRACAGSTCSDYSPVAFVAADPPPVPEDLQGWWEWRLEVATLMWEYPSEEIGVVEFELERGIAEDGSPDSWDRIATTTQPEYTDGPLTSGPTYAYRVRACDGVTCSAYSDEFYIFTGSLFLEDSSPPVR